MVKLVGFIKKRPKLTPAAFAAHWLGIHAAIARGFPGLRGYRINLVDRVEHHDAAYESFSELWFESREGLDAAFTGPVGAQIAADIPNFIGELVRVVVDEHEVALPGG